MHKKCKGCKAFEYNKCLLGYEISNFILSKDLTMNGITKEEYYPLKKCPKPLTYKKYIECMENLRSYNPWDEEEQ